jgi:hypothetical protein
MIGVRARKEAALAGSKSISLPKTVKSPAIPAKETTPVKQEAKKKEEVKPVVYTKKPPKKLTAAELAEKTKDYFIIKDYETIKVGSYVRYLDADGGYHQGGYVLGNKEGKFVIGTSLGISRIRWVLKYENISKLFLRKQTEAVILTSQVDGLNEMVGALIKYMKIKDGKKFVDFVKSELEKPTNDAN